MILIKDTIMSYAYKTLVANRLLCRVANQRCDLFAEFIKRCLNDYHLAHKELLIIHDLKLRYYRACFRPHAAFRAAHVSKISVSCM